MIFRAVAGISLVVLMSRGAFGQPAATPPAFEVASIRPSDPDAQGG